MKKIKHCMKWLSFIVAAIAMVFGGGTFAMAEGAATNPVGPIDGPGQGVKGGQTLTESQALTEQQGNLEFYLKELNKRIVMMKMESCPIDQILRAQERVNHASSITIKYYSVGQRPITSTLSEAVCGSTAGTTVKIKPTNNAAFDSMDIIMFPEVMGWEADGVTRSTLVPLQVRVMAADSTDLYPYVAAINGQKCANLTRFGIPDLPQGTKMLRLGRAAAEMDVETGSYYVLPEASEKYCQRFIMQCEQSIIERMSAKEIPWTFSRQERIAMDDMRGGIERQGLFGYNNKMIYGGKGAIYTTGGIFWDAGKDIELGHWIQKKDENGTAVTTKDTDGNTKNVYEYVISEKELTSFVAAAIKDAGNASRTKMLFVDNLIYQAFTNMRSNRRVITQTEKNYQGWGLDFESFDHMGTKILVYRHDGFNYQGMDGHAFLLDARYLEKWVFGDWSRKEYDLKNLFLRNSNAVVMEEFSCWTLSYPQAHARVSRPVFDTTLGVTDEVIAA